MDERIKSALWSDGYAIVPDVVTPEQAAELIAGYGDDAAYRSTIDMQRHNFGRGEYRYYRTPLPPVVQRLRETWYEALAPVANEWNEATRVKERYPQTLDAYLQACHEKNQVRPTPLILRYRAGDYNCMHQDVYGELGFPFQLTIPLSARDADFDGGETVLLDQAPRLQARPTVLRPDIGEALIFPNRTGRARVHPATGFATTCGTAWLRWNAANATRSASSFMMRYE